MSRPCPPSLSDIVCDAVARRYYIQRPEGVYIRGFQHLREETIELARRLGEAEPDLPEGSPELPVRLYQLMDIILDENLNLGTWYHPGTPRPLQHCLERLRCRATPCRVWVGDQETGRIWWTDQGVTGHLDRTIGPLQKPIMMGPDNSVLPLMSEHILAVATWVDTKREFVYQADKFALPAFRQQPVPGGVAVMVGEEELGVFYNSIDAELWCMFQEGQTQFLKFVPRIKW